MMRWLALLICNLFHNTFAWETYVEVLPYNFDGTGVAENDEGSAGTPFLKNIDYTALDYTDLPSARVILQELYLSSLPLLSDLGANQALAYWGLLLYYDIVDTTPTAVEFNIPCDDGVADSMCDVSTCASDADLDVTIPYYAVEVDDVTGIPLNAATSFFDLDSIYGRSEAASNLLRTFEGGYLQLTDQELPPFVVNADTGENEFQIADQRYAKLPGTFALNVLLMRHHNWYASILNNATYLAELEDLWGCTPIPCTEWGDEEIFQAARMYNIAAAQHVTINEFGPRLLGLSSSVDINADYDSTVDVGVDLLSAIALRWPYFALSPIDKVLNSSWIPDQKWDLTPVGYVCSSDDLYDMVQSNGIDAIMRGMFFADGALIDAYLPPRTSTSCLDDPVYDIQAGRDFGMPSYNDAREALGLERVATFADISTDANVVAVLENLYGDVDVVDMLVGGLAETKMEGQFFGELFWNILNDLFLRIKISDPYWHHHENIVADARATSLAYLASIAVDPVGAFTETEETTTTYPVDSFKALRYTPTEQSDSNPTIILVQDVYELSWVIDEVAGTITFNITLTGMGDTGYVAVGLGEKMVNADIFAFIEFQNGDISSISDRYGIDNDLPPTDVENYNGDNSVTLVDDYFDETTNQWLIQFSRNLAASDDNDQTISESDMYFIWSYNLEDIAQHSFVNRGINLVNFYTGTNVVISSGQEKFFIFHGIVMSISWGLCGPLAFYVTRYKKHWRNWLEIHEMLAAFAVEASIPIVIAAIATADGEFKTAHGRIGLVLLFLIIFQFTSGNIRKAGILNRGNKYFGTNYDKFHQRNKIFHRYFGKVVVLIGVANVVIGLNLISPFDSTVSFSGLDGGGGDSLNIQIPDFAIIAKYIYPAILCVFGILFLGSEINLWVLRRKNYVTAKIKFDLPSYSMEQFNERVLQGQKWVLVNDAVIDIADYMKAHPGGSKVLKESVGTNVTRELLGTRGIEQGANDCMHRHSGKAWLAIQDMVCAYVSGDQEIIYAEVDGFETVENEEIRRQGSFIEQSFIKYVLRSKKVIGKGTLDSPVLSFVFEPKDVKARYKPIKYGVFHKFRVVVGTNVIQRSYTPVHQPLIRPGVYGFEYYIRLYKGGQMSSVLGAMEINETVRVQGPCVLKEMSKEFQHVYLLAGGTGVTPMLQLIRGHINRQKSISNSIQTPSNAENKHSRGFTPARTISLLWQTHSEKDSFCLQDLEKYVTESKEVRSSDQMAGVDFYYTNYVSEFYSKRGIMSPGGHRYMQKYNENYVSVRNNIVSLSSIANRMPDDKNEKFLAPIDGAIEDGNYFQQKKAQNWLDFGRIWRFLWYVLTGFENQLISPRAGNSSKRTSAASAFPEKRGRKERRQPIESDIPQRKENFDAMLVQAVSMRSLENQKTSHASCTLPRNEIVEGKISVESLNIHLAPLLSRLKFSEKSGFLQLPEAMETAIFVSGSPGFVDSIEKCLKDIGIPESIIHYLD